MSPRENRQYRPGRPNNKDASVDEQKLDRGRSGDNNEDLNRDEDRDLDELWSHPEYLPGQHVEDDFSGKLA